MLNMIGQMKASLIQRCPDREVPMYRGVLIERLHCTEVS